MSAPVTDTTTITEADRAATPVILTAKKDAWCVNWRAKVAGNAPKCFGLICAGDRYEQGDLDPICAGCSQAVREESHPHVLAKNCHVCGTDHGTNYYVRVCAARSRAEKLL